MSDSDSLTIVDDSFHTPTLSSVFAGVVFERASVLGLEFIVINTGRWCYPDKRCFQPHSLAHVDGTFTVAGPHFLTSFHRHIRWGTQYQETRGPVDQSWRPCQDSWVSHAHEEDDLRDLP